MVLENIDLVAAREQLTGRLGGLQADQYQLLLRDPTGAQNLAEQIARTEAELARAEQRIGQLEVRAKAVSYTHLDVYKRQRRYSAATSCSLSPRETLSG